MHQYRAVIFAGAVTLALMTSGCGGSSGPSDQSAGVGSTTSSSSPASTPTPLDSQTPSAALDATATAKQVKQPTTTKVVTITEDNDPNNLIGRPNGYVSAAVIYDSNAACTEIGVSCGATVEVWPDEASAKARSDYIQAILKDAPMLGSEFHTLEGAVLLRVDGNQLKPSQAKAYAEGLSQ